MYDVTIGKCEFLEIHTRRTDIYWASASLEVDKVVDTYDGLTWRAKLAPAVRGRLSTSNNGETWQVDLVDRRIDHFYKFRHSNIVKNIRVKYITIYQESTNI